MRHIALLRASLKANKTDYYKSLKETQKTLQSKNPDYTSWLNFFIECLKKQQDLLTNNKESLKAPISKSQKRILEFAESVTTFQNNDVSEKLNMNKKHGQNKSQKASGTKSS